MINMTRCVLTNNDMKNDDNELFKKYTSADFSNTVKKTCFRKWKIHIKQIKWVPIG